VSGEGAESILLQRQVPAVVDVDHDGWFGDTAVLSVVDTGACGGPEGGEILEFATRML
jgi:hypothetical protein